MFDSNPGQAAPVLGAPSHSPEGCGFNSRFFPSDSILKSCVCDLGLEVGTVKRVQTVPGISQGPTALGGACSGRGRTVWGAACCRVRRGWGRGGAAAWSGLSQGTGPAVFGCRSRVRASMTFNGF